MENNDRQQDGGNFGEVREDVFVDPFAGEAVSEDAGAGEWGGLLNWDLPQEQQQGFVEDEYDPGFIPEGEHTPGSEYDPGFVPEGESTPGSEYDPVFTWGDFEDDVVDKEPAEDTPAADPWGTTPLLGMAGQEADARDSGNEEIEMPPEYVGRAEAAGQEQPNDAPVLLGAPPPEPVEQASAGDGEIEMPPEYVGQAGADTAVDENDIEMLSDDAGQAGAADGEMEEIEFTPEEGAAIPAQPDDAGDGETEMTGDEEIETTGSEDADLAARYDNVSDGNHPRFAFSSEEYLADYYKQLYKQLNGSDQEPDMAGLDTYDKLRTGVYKLWEQRDGIFEQHERDMDAYYKQWFKNKFGYESGEDDWRENSKYITGTKDSDEDVSTETTPGDAGQAGDDATVDENDIEMLPDDAGQAGAADGEMEEIEFTPEEAAAIPSQADAGDGEIEMPPDYVGRINIGRPHEVSQDEAHEKELADYSSYEDLAGYYKEIFNGLPDNYRIPGNVDHLNKLDLKSGELDTYEELKAATKKLLEQRDLQDEANTRLEARYGNDISGDPGLQTYDQLADYYKGLHTVLYDGQAPDMQGLDTYEKLKLATYEVMQSRDSYLKQHGLLEEKDEKVESDVDDPDSVTDFIVQDVLGFDFDEDIVDHVDDPGFEPWQ